MRIHQFAWVLAVLLAGAAPAESAPKENWIGAWGFVPTPLPPGVTPSPPASTVIAVPLAAAPTLPAPPPATPLLIDNPGNVPVVVPDADPSNVTIRQLVRVSVAGKRIRLRFSNEGGSDVLMLGAVHVAAAGPDGSIVAGSDRTVTFDGHGAISVPASAPLLSDPIEMPVEALQKLVISAYVPGALSRSGHALYQDVSGIQGDQTAQLQLPSQQ